MWPNWSQMKPEPVPSTFASEYSSPSEVEVLPNSISFMYTTEDEVSYNNHNIKKKKTQIHY